MKYAIIYSSQTGNTKLLADYLEMYLKNKDYIKYETKHADKVDADFYFIGFWTYKGECDSDTGRFLETLKNKKVFLFGTAGFGKSSSYYKRILRRTCKHIDESVNLYGSFLCQGKMSPKIKEKYEKKLTSFFCRLYAKYMIKNYEDALSHPNEEDIRKLCSKANSILNTISHSQDNEDTDTQGRKN